MAQLRILVVDDSASFRAELAQCIDRSGVARVVAHAPDGSQALTKVVEFSPDLVTLDIEMPVLGGIETLTRLRHEFPRVNVLMVSAHTRQGADLTLKALELGATDFITKPTGGSLEENREKLRQQVQRFILPFAERARLGNNGGRSTNLGPSSAATPPLHDVLPRPSAPGVRIRPEIVVIGSSTGGPAALAKIIPELPRDLTVPVVVVQHMPEMFTQALAASLAQRSRVSVMEAQQGMELRPGHVLIAPGGKHLRVLRPQRGPATVDLTQDPPENFCRPAVDYLFRSVAVAYGPAALGVILTGIGKDGTLGLGEMRRHGVHVIGQSEESCTVYGMPRAAAAAGYVDIELPAESIAQEIVSVLKGRSRSGRSGCS